MEIGIIGFGNFGRFMAKRLKNKASIFAADITDKSKEAQESGINFASLDEVAAKKIVILAVPMEKLEETLNKIRNRLQAGALVLDVCSLKMFACDAMNRILPSNVEIIGTHPLFGPQSAPNSIAGMRIALCKVRCSNKTFSKVEEFCKSFGLKVIIATPEEHDRQMAVSQALTHFIGQVAKQMNLKRVNLSTKTFDDLMNIVDIIKNDTPALFENMQTMNPFAKEARESFISEGIKLDNILKKLKGGK